MTCLPPIRPTTHRPACTSRRKFTTREAAAAAANSIAVMAGQHRLPYPCSICNGWHLS